MTPSILSQILQYLSFTLPDNVHNVLTLFSLVLEVTPQSCDLDQSTQLLVVLNEYSELDILVIFGVILAPAAGRLHHLVASLTTLADMVFTVCIFRGVGLHQQTLAHGAGQGVAEDRKGAVEILEYRMILIQTSMKM